MADPVSPIRRVEQVRRHEALALAVAWSANHNISINSLFDLADEFADYVATGHQPERQ